MCGRFYDTYDLAELKRSFEISGQSSPDYHIRYNIAPTQSALVIRETGDSRDMEMMRWGLIPHWAKDAKIGGRMINARAETVRVKPAFKHAYAARRLIVPASGFYEWKREGTHKQPFAIHRPDGAPLAFAGLWETWRDIDTFTIVTTTAVDTMGQVHERLPLILSPADYDRWLDPENDDPVDVLRSVPDVALEVTPVSDWVNSARHDDARCLEPMPSAR